MKEKHRQMVLKFCKIMQNEKLENQMEGGTDPQEDGEYPIAEGEHHTFEASGEGGDSREGEGVFGGRVEEMMEENEGEEMIEGGERGELIEATGEESPPRKKRSRKKKTRLVERGDIGDLDSPLTRLPFAYRQVTPMDYGLSVEEVSAPATLSLGFIFL